ncbi:hypothetical protein [Planococcus faecalis]
MVSQKIIREHNGTLTISSTAGLGTVAKIILPAY